MPDLRVNARSLAYLYGAGATLVGLSIVLPHPARSEATLVGIMVAAYIVTGVLLVLPQWLGLRSYHAVLLLGTLLVSLGVYATHGSALYGPFYVWVALYAFYFFSPRAAGLHVAAVGVAYAAALALSHAGDAAIARWLVTLGTAAVAGTFVARLVATVRARAADAAARAERLDRAERRTRSILETANEAFVAMDDTGVLVDVNPRTEELIGRSRSELVGRPASSSLVPKRLRPEFERAMAGFLSGEHQVLPRRSIEFVALRRDGTELPVELTASSLRDGERWVLNAFVRDITERKRAERQMRDQIEDLEIVAGVTRDLSSVTDARAARPAICKAAAELATGSVGILYEPDAKGRSLVSTAVYGARGSRIEIPFAGQPSGATIAFSSGRPHFVADLPGNPNVAQRVVDDLGAVSAYWQPILRGGTPIGVLAVAWKERVDKVTPRVASLIGLLAAEAAVATERADLLGRLEAVARTDDLTGLANRRAWEEHLPRELARADRDGSPLCVAMLDLDRFKTYNDVHGHPAGDRLLKEVTAAWRDILRPTDLIARYGGEEFVLLLPGCEIVQALEVVERLRSTKAGDQTCSAGIAQWDRAQSADELVDCADRALYEAKKEGRDRTVAAA